MAQFTINLSGPVRLQRFVSLVRFILLLSIAISLLNVVTGGPSLWAFIATGVVSTVAYFLTIRGSKIVLVVAAISFPLFWLMLWFLPLIFTTQHILSAILWTIGIWTLTYLVWKGFVVVRRKLPREVRQATEITELGLSGSKGLGADGIGTSGGRDITELWRVFPWRALVVVSYWFGAVALMGASFAFAPIEVLLSAFPLCFGIWVSCFYFFPLIKILQETGSLDIVRAVQLDSKSRHKGYYFGYLIRHGHYRVSTVGWTLGALASAVALLAMASTGGSSNMTSSLQLLFIAGIVATRHCYVRAKGSLLRAGTPLATPTGRFALYLRSFSDDELVMDTASGAWQLFVGRSGVSAILALAFETRFEEVVVPTMWRYMPVVAISPPGRSSPRLGAIRVSVSDEWQSEVKKAMESAERIVMVAGFTSGVLWEYENLLRPEFLQKTVIVVPPEDESLISDRYRKISSIGGKQVLIEENAFVKAVALIFDQSGRPVFVTAGHTGASYRLALKLCFLPRSALERIIESTSSHLSVSSH